jgi:hypothetical protein
LVGTPFQAGTRAGGRGAADRAGCRSMAGDWRPAPVPSNRRAPFTAELRASRPVRPTSGRDVLATPARLPFRSRKGGRWAPHRSHTASAILDPTLAIMQVQVCLEDGPSNQRAFHTRAANGDAGPAAPVPSWPPLNAPPGSPAQALCLNSRYIPSQTQLTRSVVPPAVRHLP